MSLLTEGLTKIDYQEIDFPFEAVGASTNAGIPFIRTIKDDGRISVSATDTDDILYTYLFSTKTGALKGKAKLTDNKHLNSIFVDVADTYSCGPWGMTGYIYVQNLNEFAANGNTLVYAKKTLTGTNYIAAAKDDMPDGHKILGVIVNTKATYAMVITAPTTDDPTDGYSYTDCQYFIFSGKGLLHGSGTVDGSVSIDTFGFGRSAVWGSTASVLEFDNQFVWAANGTDPYPVTLWSFESGVLTLVSTASGGDGIGTSAYTGGTKPAVAIRNGRMVVLAGEIIYKYRRVAIDTDGGLSYESSKTWIMDIIKTECALSGGLADIPVTLTNDIPDTDEGGITFSAGLDTQGLQGFMTTGGAVRDNLDAVRAIGFFDPLVRGYGFRFQSRSSMGIDMIPWGHLGATAGNGESVGGIEYALKNETKIPKVIEITFQDLFRNFNDNTIRVESETLVAQGKEAINFPGVLSVYDARNIANTIKIIRYTEKVTYSSTLPQIYSYLEVGDCVDLELEFEDTFIYVRVRLQSLNTKMDGTIAFTAISIGSATYGTPEPEVLPPVDEEEPPLPENAATLYLDLPAINVILQNNYAIVVAASPTSEESDTWGGNSIFLSIDEGQTYTSLVNITTPSVIGSVSTTSPLMPECYLIDRGTEVTVNLLYGELVSITEPELFANKNMAAWGNDAEGWEIFQFQTATLNMDGTYTLTTLLRGLYGTERATEHSQYDMFVLLNGNGETVIFPENVVGVDASFKSLNSGETLDDGDVADFVYDAVNLKPWSCVKGTAVRDAPSTDDITLSWVRRSRYNNGWRSNIEVPLNETSEYYQIDIMDGSDIVRTFSATSPTGVYTAADQTTDFGSPQSSVTFRIYQVSSSAGRGFVYEVTL